MRYNLFMGVNEMHVKNITITVSVRVGVTVRVSLVWRHRHFLFRKISKLHGFSAIWDSAKWGITISDRMTVGGGITVITSSHARHIRPIVTSTERALLPVPSLSWRTADEECIRPTYTPPLLRQDSDDNVSASRCVPINDTSHQYCSVVCNSLQTITSTVSWSLTSLFSTNIAIWYI